MARRNLVTFLGFKKLYTINLWKAVLAEMLASCLYIIVVCGAGLHVEPFEKPSILHISLTVGLTVAVLASGFWDISGGHFNPAVTFALLINGSVSLSRCVLYFAGQMLGSYIGAVMLAVFTPNGSEATLGSLQLNEKISPGIGFLIEAVLTFILIWTTLCSADPKRGLTGFQAPLAIGFSVAISLLMGIPYTGAALNPIRAFGPAVYTNNRDHHWIYWIGPLTGSFIATISYNYVFKLNDEDEKAAERSQSTRSNIAVVKNKYIEQSIESIREIENIKQQAKR